MTRVFPQLASGAMTQFPLRFREHTRTTFNQTEDGRRIRYSDAGASEIEWALSHSALSSDEWFAVESLFRDCEGRRLTFLFLDPSSNLIAESESFIDSVWTRAPGLGLSEGSSDPLGRPRATQITNSAGSLQSISQSIAIPAWFRYCLSIHARATTPTQMRLTVSTDGAFAENVFDLSPEWERYSLLSAMITANEELEVAVQLPAGATVEVFGAQLEAQPSASPYQRTTWRTGRYPDSRFADDTLTQTSTGPDEHSAVLRIITRVVANA